MGVAVGDGTSVGQKEVFAVGDADVVLVGYVQAPGAADHDEVFDTSPFNGENNLPDCLDKGH